MTGQRADSDEPAGRAAGASPPRARKIMVCVTEDWFALSHFKPLVRAFVRIAREVVVVTRSSGRMHELEALGARAIDFDYLRSNANPLKGWQVARNLRHVIDAEAPDAVHLVSLKPIVTGALALSGGASPAVAVHLTGLGLLAIAQSPRQNALRFAAVRAMHRLLRREHAWLFVENEDDLAIADDGSKFPRGRVTILGGAGVDIAHFKAMPPPDNLTPAAAYVGRMIYSKGIDTLVAAIRLLRSRGIALHLDLYGKIDTGNPEAVTEREIRSWESDGLVRWHGHVADVRSVWQSADIFVMATRGGEGMPRSMLEAAACARPLVVTDVPGCRHFVTDGHEGLVVPPDDPEALARALTKLAADPALRQSMGATARARVASGFTEADVEAALIAAYQTLLSR